MRKFELGFCFLSFKPGRMVDEGLSFIYWSYFFVQIGVNCELWAFTDKVC